MYFIWIRTGLSTATATVSYRLIKWLIHSPFNITSTFQCTFSHRLDVSTCSFWRDIFYRFPLSSPFLRRNCHPSYEVVLVQYLLFHFILRYLFMFYTQVLQITLQSPNLRHLFLIISIDDITFCWLLWRFSLRTSLH